MSEEHVVNGPCFVNFGGTSLGLTHGNVVFNVEADISQSKLFGVPDNYDYIVTGTKVYVDVPIAEHQAWTLEEVLRVKPEDHWGALFCDNGVTSIDMHARDLSIMNVSQDLEPPSTLIYLPAAIPIAKSQIAYSHTKVRVFNFRFLALLGPPWGKKEEQYLACIGDSCGFGPT